jgi:DUF4097 and DUF4098 domain-containing protein YvlB
MVFFAMAFSVPLAEAADFHKTYDRASSGFITIFTWNGDIKLSGYDGRNVEVTAVKKGPDRDLVEIQDDSFGNHVHLFSKYLDFGRNNATVDYEVRVPKEIFYNQIYLKSNSGTITVKGVAGSLRLETVGRAIEVRDVEGMLMASSVSGDVKGYLKQTTYRSVLRFASISGNISVQAPPDLSAQVHLESASGRLKTDFPLEAKETRYGSGKFAFGKLGAGNQVLDIRSVSGAVTLSKKQAEGAGKAAK